MVVRSRALLARTRHIIAVNHRRLNPWWGLSGSSETDGDRDLRMSVRDRLERGVLVPAPNQVWAGKGTGKTCAICAKSIAPDEIENEIDIRGGGVAVKLWAHQPCLAIWHSESNAFEVSGPHVG